MNKILKLALLSGCFVNVSFGAEAAQPTAEQSAGAHATSVCRSPFNYEQYRTQYFTNNCAWSNPLFGGAFGLPEGLDPNLISIFQNLGCKPEVAVSSDSRLMQVTMQLKRHIQNVGGPLKDDVLEVLDRSMSHGQPTIASFVLSVIEGLANPSAVDPRTAELVNHTIISKTFQRCLKSTLAKLLNGKEHKLSESGIERFDNEQHLSGATSYYAHAKQFRDREDDYVQPFPFFGGKFGVVNSFEAFCERLSIVGIPQTSYKAHGVPMEPFSAVMHDAAHYKVMRALDQVLRSVVYGMRDHHLALGGSAKDLTEERERVFFDEQTRFLNVLSTLNQQAFKRFGGGIEYREFALGLFLLTHEILTISSDMIMSLDFSQTLENMINDHVRALNRSEAWESANDPLKTSPRDGKSELSNDDIIKKMIQKNRAEIYRHLPHIEASAFLMGRDTYKIELDALLRRMSEVSEPEADAGVEELATHQQKIDQLKKEIAEKQALLDKADRAIFEQAESMELRNKTGDFYDLVIELTNGKKLLFSETTLHFKRHNYKDTQGLMKIVGINLPDMAPDADRATVQANLKLGVTAWEGVMRRFGTLAQHLFVTTPGLSDDFFHGRFDAFYKLKKDLAAGRNPDLKTMHDYRPEEAKKMFTGW